MNETQAIFTLFFAISWGVVSNVLPRWKPFHYALAFHCGFWQPTWRLLVACTLLNVIPWIIFVLVVVWLRGDALQLNDWTFLAGLLLIVRAVLPGLVPFGCYRVWLAIIRIFPTCFYGENPDAVPPEFRAKRQANSPPMEPDVEHLDIRPAGVWKDLGFGIFYIGFCFLALVPGYRASITVPPVPVHTALIVDGIDWTKWAAIGQLAGAAATFIAVVIMYKTMRDVITVNRRKQLTKRLSVKGDSPHGLRARCRVINGGDYTIESAIPYITIVHEDGDIVDPPEGQSEAFIKPSEPIRVSADRLCWSFSGPERHIHQIDIYAKEEQALSPFEVLSSCIKIPSEKGWDKPRVYLTRKIYSATLKIVSKDTDARIFAFEIDPSDMVSPLRLTPLQRSESGRQDRARF
jgi:hypothetical protein